MNVAVKGAFLPATRWRTAGKNSRRGDNNYGSYPGNFALFTRPAGWTTLKLSNLSSINICTDWHFYANPLATWYRLVSLTFPNDEITLNWTAPDEFTRKWTIAGSVGTLRVESWDAPHTDPGTIGAYDRDIAAVVYWVAGQWPSLRIELTVAASVPLPYIPVFGTMQPGAISGFDPYLYGVPYPVPNRWDYNTGGVDLRTEAPNGEMPHPYGGNLNCWFPDAVVPVHG